MTIKVDGINHLEKDQKRQAESESYDIKVLRYLNTDIYDNIDWVFENFKYEIKQMASSSHD